MNLNKKQHYIFAEKYRPKTINEFTGNDIIRDKFKEYIENGDIPHLLLYGTSGVGKCLDFDENITVEIDVSDDEYQILKKYELK